MSSPRRAPKAAAKTVAKAARKTSAKRRSALRAGTKPAVVPARGASGDAERLAAVMMRGIVDNELDVVSAEALQKLIAAASRLYTARREAGEQFTPVPQKSISATDVMVTASGLLKAADLAVFELGMWQSWTGR